MSTRLADQDINNPQIMEVWVNGPEEANRLFICSGAAQLLPPPAPPYSQRATPAGTTTFTLLIGPQLTRRQFVRATASGAISRCPLPSLYEINIASMDADFDDESGRVEVRLEFVMTPPAGNPPNVYNSSTIAIAYNISILAQFPATPAETMVSATSS